MVGSSRTVLEPLLSPGALRGLGRSYMGKDMHRVVTPTLRPPPICLPDSSLNGVGQCPICTERWSVVQLRAADDQDVGHGQRLKKRG